MLLARELTSIVNPRIMGCVGVSKPTLQKYTPLNETILQINLRGKTAVPEDMQLPEDEQRLLWNEFYATKEEA
jgi:hypothetical protein